MQSNYHKILFKFLCSSTFHIISLQWHPTPLFLRIHGNAHAGIRSCTHMQSTKGIWSQCLPLRAVDLSSVLCDILILSGYSLPIHPVLLQSHTHLGIRLLSPLPLSPSASVPFNVLCAQRVGDLESHRINLQHQNTHTHKQQTGPRHSGVHPQKSPSYCPSEFQKWRTKSEESTWSLHLTNTRMHARHWQGKADYLWQTRCHFYVLLLRDSGGKAKSEAWKHRCLLSHCSSPLTKCTSEFVRQYGLSYTDNPVGYCHVGCVCNARHVCKGQTCLPTSACVTKQSIYGLSKPLREIYKGVRRGAGINKVISGHKRRSWFPPILSHVN